MQKNKIDIHLFVSAYQVQCCGWAGAHLGCHRARDGVHSGQVATLSITINKLTKKWINCFLNVLSAQNLTSGASLNKQKKKPQN